MNDIEKRLIEQRRSLESVTAPEELEIRLRSALQIEAAPERKKWYGSGWKAAVVVLLAILMIGNQYNAVAYYGKKFFGFDEVSNETLRKLNEQGAGQTINQTIRLSDDSSLTIDGIMTDANQLVMYYTWSRSNGTVDPMDSPFTFSSIHGFLTNSRGVSGTSILNEDHTEMKGTMSFEPVSPFAKKLTLRLHITRDGKPKEEAVTFSYYPDQALQTSLKRSINETLKVDQGKVRFKSITATPTMTVIEGKLDVENFDRIQLGLHGVELLANGKAIPLLGSGVQSEFMGTRFQIKYDALPEEIDSLQLAFREFVGYQTLNEKIELNSIRADQPITLANKELWIKDIAIAADGVEVSIATDEDVLLDGVSIEGENEKTPLLTTIKHTDPIEKGGKMVRERVMLFDTHVKPEFLLIRGMHYKKSYDRVINIPIR